MEGGELERDDEEDEENRVGGGEGKRMGDSWLCWPWTLPHSTVSSPCLGLAEGEERREEGREGGGEGVGGGGDDGGKEREVPRMRDSWTLSSASLKASGAGAGSGEERLK